MVTNPNPGSHDPWHVALLFGFTIGLCVWGTFKTKNCGCFGIVQRRGLGSGVGLLGKVWHSG